MQYRVVVVFNAVVLIVALFVARDADAQVLRTLSSNVRPEAANSICGQRIPQPVSLPPPGSGPVVYLISPCFQRQGGRPRFSPESYLGDIRLKPSRPSAGDWTPYDAAAEQVMLQDYERLSASSTRPLTDLTIEIRDYTFSNGVTGKLVIYDMIERN